MGLNKKYLALFSLPKTETEVRLVPGDELRLRPTDEKHWSRLGSVIRIDHEEIVLQMRSNQGLPRDTKEDFVVDFVWKSTSYDRMEKALKTFVLKENALSTQIFHRILGRTQPSTEEKKRNFEHVIPPNLPDLNHSQLNAVKQVLSKPVSLIQGPPGTGKVNFSSQITIEHCGLK